MRYGCHNRPEAARELLAQDGWLDTGITQRGQPRVATRLPRMVWVPVPFSPGCQHALAQPTDPACTGCIWQHPPDTTGMTGISGME
ncbi:hypothetical protein OKW39_009085 [Paraburkholderia sp. MM6662-R1]